MFLADDNPTDFGSLLADPRRRCLDLVIQGCAHLSDQSSKEREGYKICARKETWGVKGEA